MSCDKVEQLFLDMLEVLAISSGCDPAAVLIDDALAVLLEKFALLRRQEVDHEFRRTAESHPFRRHHDRPVEENRMRLDCVEQGVLREVAVVKPQFVKNWLLIAQQGTQRHARAGRKLTYQNLRRRGFQIFNDMRLNACVADEAERIARRAATGIMVDDDIHWRHAPAKSR